MTTSGNWSGRYRSYRGVAVPTACPPGSYCPSGTTDSMEFLCPARSFSNQSSLWNYTQCTPCEPGKYCNGEGQNLTSLTLLQSAELNYVTLLSLLSGNTEPTDFCAAGHYCTLGAETATPVDGITGDICPEGKYCPVGTIVGVDCPKGTFSNLTGLMNETQCEACTPGHHCSQTGLTDVSGTCWAG